MKFERFLNLPVLLSVGMHSILMAVIIINWTPAKPEQEEQPPHFVKATLVDMQPKAIAAPQQPKPQVLEAQRRQEQERRRQEEQKRQQAEAQKRQQEQQQREEKAKAEAQQQQKVKEEQARQAAAKAKAEQEKKAEAAKQAKAKAEQQKKAEQERQAKAEQERKNREQQQREEAERREAALQKEQQHLSDRSDSVNTQTWEGLIREQVTENWSRPPGARNGITVVLEVNMVPTGQVMNVRVVKSSGDIPFDRSAEQAVKRVGQFQGIREMPNDVFERYFRVFQLTFRPEDLRQ